MNTRRQAANPSPIRQNALFHRLMDEESRSDATNSTLNFTQTELNATRATLDETLEKLSVTKTALANRRTVAGLFFRLEMLIGDVSAG